MPSKDDTGGGPERGIPERVGNYRVLKLLGRGGMGEVYAAVDERLRRPVALKVILKDHAGDADARARFFREAQTLAALDHTGIVRIYEMGDTGDGDLFIAMERVEGRALSQFLGRAWPFECAVRVIREAAGALGAAHDAGIIHRDVKPGNLVVDGTLHTRILDFGLARDLAAPDQDLTRTGYILGTPAYMSPEQARADELGPSSDVFCLGVVLYQLLAGSHPFLRDSDVATAVAIAGAEHAGLVESRPDVSRRLAAVVHRCLAIDPQERYADGADLARALEACNLTATDEALTAFLDADPSIYPAAPAPSPRSSAIATRKRLQARKPWGPLAAIGLVALLGVAWLIWGRGAPSDTPTPVAGTLPPRPIVAVLEIEPASDAAEVTADLIRHYLESDSTRLLSVPRATLLGMDPSRGFRRPDRALGHVDFLVRGTLDGATLELEIQRTENGETLPRLTAVAATEDPFELAEIASAELMRRLGARPPESFRVPTRSVEAYAAYLRAQESQQLADLTTVRAELETALRLDPSFYLGRLERLWMLRSDRRWDDLATEADTLLDERDQLPEYVVAASEAMRALGRHEDREATRLCHAVIERWPYDVTTHLILLTLRFNHVDAADLIEAERIARRVLALSPHNTAAASRLIRSLAYRGRAEDGEVALAEVGLPGDDDKFLALAAELALLRGRFDEAVEKFDRANQLSEGDTYARHMAIAALILDDRCEEAAHRALDQIHRVETVAPDANLAWTYSLGFQAMLCQQQWDPGLKLFARWVERDPSVYELERVMQARVALARGEQDAQQVARSVLADIDGGSIQRIQYLADLISIYARVATDAEVLDRLAAKVSELALGAEVSMVLRENLRHTERVVTARAALLRNEPDAAARFDALVTPWALVKSEAHLALRVDAMLHRARALERLGRAEEARAAFTEIAELGYPRLWVTDIWVLSRQRAGL